MIIRQLLGITVNLILLSVGSLASQTQFRSLTYEDAWKEGRFSGRKLENVTYLVKDGPHTLTAEKKEYLKRSVGLTNLKVLDLSNQTITDEDVEEIANNPTFSRVFRIDLSENPDITAKSLETISSSRYLGSIRDLPQISSRYGRPSSEVIVTVSNTGISQSEKDSFNREPKNRKFFIRYLNPVTGESTAKPALNGIKWVRTEY